MLYLFGRLALSDSFYFNQDVHADEQPEASSAHRPAAASARDARASAPSPPPRRSSSQPLASPPAAESAA
ncbi:hypothetical protein [Hymenobacter cheonanensis]|uniref:hypothetical protein n=1 Tax=Hymenobacter sp. CA2-7 TaxID=3063993 RepID=UPI002712773C|nr:hypothetical protein [Hymenobacter sp. CA2-7]MDO7887038.1 hypothetical protein [Hymenobacter sp. CA2-7]